MSETTIRPLLLEKPIPVNGYDIDVLGIVSNIVYVRWFEDLRMHFLDTYYPFQELYKENKSPVLATTQVEYKYPLTILDQPTGYVWLSNVSKSKWECSFEIKTDSKIHAKGIQDGYFIDIERKKPTRIPEKFMDLYNNSLNELRSS
ncbi:acyl-CoA thioesterase [Marinoscillum pacificum]|uniref:acyl-CoA thioesterase n=1 Tax=Marinoscillum pacificum TaxID=392723 RepID=UPI0021583DB9|nr:thioesterase family protein [Marinoscillum pacificum]